MNELEQKHEKLVKWFKGGGAVGTAIMTVFIFAALFTVGTLMAAAATAAIVGIVMINLLPYISMKAANFALKKQKQEARDNPIETMENEFLQQAREIEFFKGQTRERIAQANVLIADVNEMRKTDPEGADAYNDEINDYRLEIETRTTNLQQAVIDHEAFKALITKLKRRWQVAEKNKEFLKNSPKEQDLRLRQMMVEESVDSIKNGAAQSMAGLKVDAIVSAAKLAARAPRTQGFQAAPQQISQAPIEAIEVPTLIIQDKVRAK